MSTTIMEPAADVVLLGVGVVSGTIAAELTLAGYKVAGVTRGPYWNYATDFASTKYDEWGIQWERKFDFPASLQTNTIRNNSTQFALPTRRATFPIQYHSLGFGVGGAAHHYGGNMGRNGPWGFAMNSMTVSRYGASMLPNVNPFDDTEDWPATYAQYEPYYTAWEQNFGISGNTNGNYEIGVPIPMSKNYPLPGHPPTKLGSAFQSATEALGYAPFPHVSSLASEPYTNPYGVQINGCVYEGWCTGGGCNFACETGAKANSAFRSIPAAVKTGNFTLALNSEIFRMDTNAQGLVTDIRYYDASGNIHIQPGTAFFNGLWGYNQVRMMLMSNVGVPYNPTTVTGTVGRGLTYGYLPYTGTSGPSGSMPGLATNSLAGNGAGGDYVIYEFMDDGFNHTGLNFIGGAQQSAGGYSGSGPTNVSTAGGVSSGSQGSTYKATLKNRYNGGGGAAHVSLGGMSPDLPNTLNMWDLDPHYVDAWGDPCARSTHDWTPNPYNCATYFGTSPGNAPFIAILQKMGATSISNGGTTTVSPYTAHTDWWGHHWRGGNRVGSNQATSTFNVWQQCWTAPNLFAAGEVNNTTGDTVPSGTHQAGMQSEIAAEGIKQYLTTKSLLTTSLDGMPLVS